MSQAAEIRLFTSQDKAAWLPLWKGYQNFYKTQISDDVSDTSWERLLNADEPMSGAFVWVDGEAAGFVHYIRHRSTWAKGDYCYLQDLYVNPEIRGKGLGRALIEHVYKTAEESGCSRVYWLTHETNTDAMVLYDRVADKSGFIQYRKML
ncbi:GNAT family N-acetyltransferase [Pseudochrobactrum sp. sp1633]|uniref:GNAT family N-acetyltransferase n=1 Tax=Pseudochrobactrum sp. sp1633 TaxID=3036706 RepID=UPI0025A5E7EC|nr:GNAT family N-acetyltransferase [Pseudochrobactrum sp. sp1633]MDM8346130.1 GNAT family N-acetyltransferase [Pseudochrobactrum sp. sp1633]HWD13805.1 GNAT family N-acetyltransferase [Pseudochrobactrum sp.]